MVKLVKRGLPMALLIMLAALTVLLMVGWQALLANRGELLWLGWLHMRLVLVSLALAVLAGVITGVLLSRRLLRSLAEYAIQLVNIGSTLPTMAVLALAMMLVGIGDAPAIVALFLASLAPIVRNSWTGLCAVPAPLCEAASGMGMTRWQCLWRVELPYAFTDILAGVRTAATINIGTAPLAFLIGASGYGELIFPGIYLNDWVLLILGASATAFTALFLDGLLTLLGFICQRPALR